LSSLAAADPIDNSWELLLIDNNSSDPTPTVAEEFRHSLPLRYVFEGNLGLSHARNRALAEAQGAAMLFTDDDVEASTSWLARYASAMAEWSDVDFFGGRILPKWSEGKRPTWLRDESMPLIAAKLCHYDLGTDVRYYRSGEPLPYGASFAVRRPLVERVGRFRADLGVRGETTGRGEEAEYMQRAVELGMRGLYVGSALCFHWNRAQDLSLGRLYRYGVQKGVEVWRRSGTHPHGGALARQASYLARGLYQLARGRGDRFRQCVVNIGIERGISQERRRVGA
jgi:glycosyltransferase involved in cell wall biosynthesis